MGRHFVQAALRQGHELTLFNRGKTNPDLFEEVEKIRGDRLQDIHALSGEWDIAVDTSAYIPRAVQIAGEHLRDRVQRYCFISTTAVYRDLSKKGVDESDYLKTLEDPDIEEVNSSTYGPLKTECEAVTTGIFDKRSLIVRPGFLAGPYDPTDRFTYWVSRIAAGGEVLAPEEPSSDVQLLDARDLADWLVASIEADLTGIYNATGPVISFEEMLATCRRATDSDATMTWVSRAFMQEMEIDTRLKMPLWNPEARGRKAGMHAVDSSRARKRGLQCRSLEETARDVLEWVEQFRGQREWLVGLDRLEEQEMLTLWHSRHDS